MNKSKVGSLIEQQKLLVNWFKKNHRSLPWRNFNRTNSRDPYKTWISEIMLQQTQVETVKKYFFHWMKDFPTVKVLSQASEKKIMSHWAGLGYYSRAKNILASAKEITKKFNGQIPTTKKELLSLKGVGEYTSGAILSLAFNKPEPILDGNIIRIFSRFYGIKFFPQSSKEKETYWNHSRQWCQTNKPQLVNEGLMELGALICTPKNPQCNSCPLKSNCFAYKTSLQMNLPVSKTRKELTLVNGSYLYILYNKKVLLYKAKKGELLQGQWNFPYVEEIKEKDQLELLPKHFKGFNNFKSTWSPKKISHAITHHKIRGGVGKIQISKISEKIKLEPGFAWHKESILEEILYSSLAKKIINSAKKL